VRLHLTDDGKLKATGDSKSVGRWSSRIRDNRAAIIESLKVGASGTAVRLEGWKITHADGRTIEHYFSPPQTHAEVEAQYPGMVIVPVIEVPTEGGKHCPI
jgi:hypothetical protein